MQFFRAGFGGWFHRGDNAVLHEDLLGLVCQHGAAEGGIVVPAGAEDFTLAHQETPLGRQDVAIDAVGRAVISVVALDMNGYRCPECHQLWYRELEPLHFLDRRPKLQRDVVGAAFPADVGGFETDRGQVKLRLLLGPI